MKPCAINVAITDLRIYLCRARVSPDYIPRGPKGNSTVYLKQFAPCVQNLALGGGQNTIIAPFPPNRRITHIAIAFLSNIGTQNVGKYTPTDFSSGFTSASPDVKNSTDVQSLLNQVTITIDGVTYPQAIF